MKSWIRISLLTVIAALSWLIMPGMQPAAQAVPCHEIQGEYRTKGTPEPFTDEYGFLCSAPVQTPALTSNPSTRLVTPSKHRVPSVRPSSLRRTVNRLSVNVYTPLAATGCLVTERMSAPMRHPRAVHFYILELCRLLC
ncbi:MAG: hypothetical protein IKH25_00065 [Muribaculaceae bacterium]|nr:hypothetical protein [Muribaculaceae bacterium]